jgi:hypothetical protein
VRVAAADLAPLVAFLTEGLFMNVLRTRVSEGGAAITTMGFGPEQYDVPVDFVPGISSFEEYGAHFSLDLVETPTGDPRPVLGDGFAYIALGVPKLRLSKLVANGGDILSSYGYTVVAAPGGLPLQIVLGDQVRDPFMFAALRVNDLKASEKFYTGPLVGMHHLPYPRARSALVSVFEPPQPEASAFLGYAEGTFGVLLLPRPRSRRRSPVDPGSVWGGLRVVTSAAPGSGQRGEEAALADPSGYPIYFVDESDFNREIRTP